MRNVNVEKQILLALNDRPVGAKFHSLMSDVENATDNYLLTTEEFKRVLSRLKDREMITVETNPLGTEFYSITTLGRQTIREEGWI